MSNSVKIVAEVAQGYEGKPVLGDLMIKGAALAGADAIKFQMVYADDVAVPGYQYYEWYKQLYLPDESWLAWKDQAHKHRMEFYTDISGPRALEQALRVKPDGAKVHSTNFYNHALVEQILTHFSKVFVSTGGIHPEELQGFIQRHGLIPEKNQVTFLYGFQAEPTPVEKNALARLPEFFEAVKGFEVGFMDHTDGAGPDAIHVSLMAQALGVRVFEKHITLDRELEIEDYASALAPAAFTEYVSTLRRLQMALGDSKLVLNDAELGYRRKMLKKILTLKELPQGYEIKAEDLVQKRVDVEGDAFCYDPDALIGKRVLKTLPEGHPLSLTDVQGESS